MSKERELIKNMKILLECSDMGGLRRNADVLINRAIELLAQPEQTEQTEQDNSQYLLDQIARLTAENAMLKEKWLSKNDEDEYINEESGYNRSDWWE
jgi:hypothetical protein